VRLLLQVDTKHWHWQGPGWFAVVQDAMGSINLHGFWVFDALFVHSYYSSRTPNMHLPDDQGN
jgi:hypothetical protein